MHTFLLPEHCLLDIYHHTTTGDYVKEKQNHPPTQNSEYMNITLFN